MGSIIFQWGFNSGGYLGIPELGFYWDFIRAYLVVLNQGRYGSGQCNLPDRMLRLDANTTLSQSYVLFITFVNITYQSGDQYLPSIYSWDSSPWQELYIPLFFSFLPNVYLTCLCVELAFFKCAINLTSFLFKSKFAFFLICDSAHLLSHYYYYYNYYFYCYSLLIFFFYMFCFAIISHFHCLVMSRYL